MSLSPRYLWCNNKKGRGVCSARRPTEWEKAMRHRATLLLAAMVVGLLVASGVALAATPINCADDTVAPCDSTTGDDEMTGTSGTDYIYAREGNDTLRGLAKFDDLRGGPGNDTLDGGGETISTTSTRITGEPTASPPTVPEHRTG